MNEEKNLVADNSEVKIKETRTIWHEVFDWIECIGITFLCALALLTFVFRVVTIDGDSMLDTLVDGENVVISNLFYTPHRGDIIVISRNYTNDTEASNDENSPIIKRVIATEGEWVNIDFEAGIVYVGKTKDSLEPLKEDYTKNLTTRRGDFVGPIQVEKGHVFVLGDNRAVSLDSRYDEIGQVDERYILGRAYLRLTPFDKFGELK